MGMKERVEQEARDLAARAGEILKEKGEELLGEAKDRLTDRVSDIVDEQKKKICFAPILPPLRPHTPKRK